MTTIALPSGGHPFRPLLLNAHRAPGGLARRGLRLAGWRDCGRPRVRTGAHAQAECTVSRGCTTPGIQSAAATHVAKLWRAKPAGKQERNSGLGGAELGPLKGDGGETLATGNREPPTRTDGYDGPGFKSQDS